jgi:hypothetical protein
LKKASFAVKAKNATKTRDLKMIFAFGNEATVMNLGVAIGCKR